MLLHTILLVQVQKKKSPDVRLKKFYFKVILQVRGRFLNVLPPNTNCLSCTLSMIQYIIFLNGQKDYNLH